MRIPGITDGKTGEPGRTRKPRLGQRWDYGEVVCRIGWHFWGSWSKPTVAAGKFYQQRVCTRCGKAQVRDAG